MNLKKTLPKFIILTGLFLNVTAFFYSTVLHAKTIEEIKNSNADNEDSAVVLLYHRFNEAKYPTTSVNRDQFMRHITELKKKKYNVIPLPQIIKAFSQKRKLPNRAIGITIDDAFASVYHVAYPMLKKANMPFTLFISTLTIRNKSGHYLTWDQIREMANDPLVTIGHHAHGHISLAQTSLDNAKKDIKIADDILKKELGFIPKIFSYPFGEYTPELQTHLKSIGIKAAFAQYSSAANSLSDPLSLPRFALNEKYSSDSRFKLIINTLALPIRDLLPLSPILKDHNPPAIGFTVDKRIKYLKNLNCYPSHLNAPAKITIIGKNRIEIRFDKAYPKGRGRINCTMPAPNKRFYWLGLPFFNFSK